MVVNDVTFPVDKRFVFVHPNFVTIFCTDFVPVGLTVLLLLFFWLFTLYAFFFVQRFFPLLLLRPSGPLPDVFVDF